MFVSLPGAALVDTQAGVGGSSTAFAAGEVRTYQATGKAGIPTSGVGTVLVDLAATTTTYSDNYAVIGAAGVALPDFGTLRYGVANVPRSTNVAVPVSADGKIQLKNVYGNTNFVVTVIGYFTKPGASGAAPGGYMSLTPARLVDSKNGVGVTAGQIPAQTTRTVAATGVGDIPAGASAIFASVEASYINSDGALSLSAADKPVPTQSSLRYAIGGADRTGLMIPLSSDGKFNVTNQGPNDVHLLIDVEGYISSEAGKGGGFHAFDTTKQIWSSGSGSLALQAGETRDIPVGGTNGMPTYAVAGAMLNVVALGYTASGSVDLYGSGQPDPKLGNVTFDANENGLAVSGASIIRPAAGGKISITNTSTGPVDVRLNMNGWFEAPAVVAPADQAAFLSQTQALGASADIANQAIYWEDLAETLPGSVESTFAPDSTAVDPSSFTDSTPSRPSDDPQAVTDNVGPVSGSQADDLSPPDGVAPRTAAEGTCKASEGYRLKSGGQTLKYHSALLPGVVVFKISLKARWCTNRNLTRIGTYYTPKPSVNASTFGGFVWKEPSASDIRMDSYWNGPSGHPRAGRRIKFDVPMEFCTLGKLGCSTQHAYMGEQLDWSGYYEVWKSSTL